MVTPKLPAARDPLLISTKEADSKSWIASKRVKPKEKPKRRVYLSSRFPFIRVIAYKPIDRVMQAQADLVEIVHELRQIVCVKG